ncbi:hypothetical protein F5877DRAFT_81267 [Lentinula edodes]|nr:hypothetical protein F5877DRAFT_81267 [Lentinula edodes]
MDIEMQKNHARLSLSAQVSLFLMLLYRSSGNIGLPQSSGQNYTQNLRQFSSTPDEDAVAAMDVSEKTNHNDMPTVEDVSYQSIPRPGRRAHIRTRVIKTAIGYDKKKWYDLLRCIRDNLAAARIDWSVPWRAQNPEQIAPIFTTVEKHFPETRRFADRWAINQIAYQYGIQRNYHRRTERDFRPDSKAEDNVPAGSIPYSIPTYKVPMKDIRQALGYDKKRWNYLRTCVRENFAAEFDWSVPWRAQNPERLARAYCAVEEHFPETRRFAERWALKAIAQVYWDACKRRGRKPFSILYESIPSTEPLPKVMIKTQSQATGRRR